MRTIYEIMRDFYGSRYLRGTTIPTPRNSSKHQASKRGYQHRHNMSKGERNALRRK